MQSVKSLWLIEKTKKLVSMKLKTDTKLCAHAEIGTMPSISKLKINCDINSTPAIVK